MSGAWTSGNWGILNGLTGVRGHYPQGPGVSCDYLTLATRPEEMQSGQTGVLTVVKYHYAKRFG